VGYGFTAERFYGLVAIDAQKCVGCQACLKACPQSDALSVAPDGKACLSEQWCLGCMACLGCCPAGAILPTVRKQEAGDLAEQP